MPYLLNVVYGVLLVLAAPWLAWQALRTDKYRDGWGQKLLGLVPRRSSTEPCIWIHAVSLGEVSLVGSLIAELKLRQPGCPIVISTTTRTGYALARTRYAEYCVFYLPFDFTWAVRRAVRRLHPAALVLAELELWPNVISAAQSVGAKVVVVNGRLSDRSFRGYRRLGGLVRHLVGKLDLVAAQNALYAQRFVELGVPESRVYVTGSLKFDGAQTDRGNSHTVRLRGLAKFASSDVVFLAGSTQHPEEQLALETYEALCADFPQLRLVIVPRHPERFQEVAQLLAASGLHWERRSHWDATGGDPAARVLLVDQVGELAAWWGTATIAYVGGSMGARQGQNMIEPAAYGCAVSFGPMTRNFRDVVSALLAEEAATVVADGKELTAFVRRCLADVTFATEQGGRAASVVSAQLGATRRTVDLLEQQLTLNEPVLPSRQAAA